MGGMSLLEFKKHFYSSDKYVHLNNSGQALIPDVNRRVAEYWLKKFAEEGAHCAIELWTSVETSREKLARFFGASTEEVAFMQTTASGLSQAAASVPLQKDDEILTWEQEYPSNFYPWRMAAERTGAKLIQVPSENWQTPAEDILKRVTARTKAVAVSWVQYQTGSVTDLKALSSQLSAAGIWLVADVIQGAGVRPLNFVDTGFDVLCGGSHKYMCSGHGAGYMLVKKDRLEQMRPLEFGAGSFGNPDTVKGFSNPTHKGARKFEPGSKALIEIIAMGATLDLFERTGIQNIFSEASRLCERLRRGLEELGYPTYSPAGSIVTLAPSKKMSLESVQSRLTENGVSFVGRGPGIRLSTHAYNTDAEIDRVLNLL